MTVGEMINALQKFEHDKEVLITDGYACTCYKGDYLITEFIDNNIVYVDIGIGGCQEEQS